MFLKMSKSSHAITPITDLLSAMFWEKRRNYDNSKAKSREGFGIRAILHQGQETANRQQTKMKLNSKNPRQGLCRHGEDNFSVAAEW